MAENENRDILKENQEQMQEIIDKKNKSDEQDHDTSLQDTVRQQKENQSVQDSSYVHDDNNAMKPTVANRKQAGE